MSSCCGSNILLKHFLLSGSSSSAFLRDYVTWQFNAFLWISLISVTFLLLRKLYNLLHLLVKGSLIPGPSFYAHSKLISGVNLTEVVSKLHDKYGSVVKLWLGPMQLLVSINDTELIREMLVKAEDKIPLTGRDYHLTFGRSSLVSSFGEVYSEIVNVWTNVRESMRKRIENMPFMLETVYESVRLLPAGPFLRRCALKHDIKLKTGVTIPAGAILMVPVQLLQTDSSSWGADAGLFNPDRFLSKAGKTSHPIHMTSFPGISDDDEREFSYTINDSNENVAFLPFGYGTRAHLCQKLAIYGVATLLASLLERYEVRVVSGLEDDSLSAKSECLHEVLPNPNIVFVPRNK